MKGFLLCLTALLVSSAFCNEVRAFDADYRALSGKSSSDADWESVVGPILQADLDGHNQRRSEHNADPLVNIASLNADAQAYAE